MEPVYPLPPILQPPTARIAPAATCLPSLLFLLNLLLAHGGDAAPPTNFTRDLEVSGDDCAVVKYGTFKYQGNTADGRPWYSVSVDVSIIGLEWTDAYVFYDANCDGKTGSDHSEEHGHPQWIFSPWNKPDPTRLVDLDGTGKCLREQNKGGTYSRTANYDWTPADEVLLVSCPSIIPGRYDKWHTVTISAGLEGCPKPYHDHTYGWSEWSSTDGTECGEGEEVRTEVESCFNVREPTCPCKNRRNPETLQMETRNQPACRTTTSTTSTTTTTTVATTTVQRQTTSTTTTTTSSSTSTPVTTPSPPSPPFTSGGGVGATSGQPDARPSNPATPSTLSGPRHNETLPKTEGDEGGIRLGVPAAASEDGGNNGGNGTTGKGGGQIGGGTIAAVVMGVLAVVGGIFATILYLKPSDGTTQQAQHPPTTHVNNRLFSIGGSSGGVGGMQSAATAKGQPATVARSSSSSSSPGLDQGAHYAEIEHVSRKVVAGGAAGDYLVPSVKQAEIYDKGLVPGASGVRGGEGGKGQGEMGKRAEKNVTEKRAEKQQQQRSVYLDIGQEDNVESML